MFRQLLFPKRDVRRGWFRKIWFCFSFFSSDGWCLGQSLLAERSTGVTLSFIGLGCLRFNSDRISVVLDGKSRVRCDVDRQRIVFCGFCLHNLRIWISTQSPEGLLRHALLQPGRLSAAGRLQSDQVVVEHRLKGVPTAIEQFHLQDGSTTAAVPLEPESVLTIGQEAVAIQADANPPACIAVPEVLQGRIPEHPVEQQRLMIDLLCVEIGNQPGLIGPGLGPFKPLPLMKLPLQGCSGALDGFSPGVSSPGRESVASRGEVIQSNR